MPPAGGGELTPYLSPTQALGSGVGVAGACGPRAHFGSLNVCLMPRPAHPSGRRLSARALVCLSLLLAGGPELAAATARTVTSIEIEGLERVTRETVLATLPIRPGQPVDESLKSEAVRSLFSTGQFKDVRIEEKAGAVTVKVVESPLVAAVRFTGNSEIKTERLSGIVGLKAGAPYSAARARKDALALIALYRAEGRPGTEVEPKTTDQPHNMVDVSFTIQEGNVVRVGTITFEGNVAFGARELENAIRTERSSWLDFIKSDSIYVADRLTEDRDLLRRHYLTHGYPEAKIVAAEGVPDAKVDGYAVRFVIDEGDRYDFGPVAVDSDIAGVDTSGLGSLIEPHEGNVFDAGKVDRTVDALSLALWEQGFKFARVRLKLTPDRARHRMSVAFRIEDGPHVSIERVEISGNAKTDTGVILREMRLKEGEPYNALMLERDKARIRKLGFFKSVTAETKPGRDKDNVVVAIAVEEDETIVVSFGGGYSTSEGVIGDVAVEERNLLGTGRRAKVKLSGSAQRLQAEASFTEPHLLDSDVSATVAALYKDFDASDQSSFKGQKVGGSVELGYALSDTVTGAVNYKLFRNTITDVGSDASAAIKDAVPGFPDATSATYYTSSVGYGLSYDTRDKPVLPTEGNLVTLTQDFAGVGGDVRYLKSTIDARTYLPLAERVTLVGRSAAGTISGWGGSDVRLLDMFYMGNEFVRGFETAGIGPRDTASRNQDALGGRHYIATTAEMRFGLPGVPDDIGLRGAVFADAGSLFGTSASAAKTPGLAGNDGSIRTSVGAGLIWDSPLGPLRADYAIPLTSAASDKTQPLSFGLAAY